MQEHKRGNSPMSTETRPELYKDEIWKARTWSYIGKTQITKVQNIPVCSV